MLRLFSVGQRSSVCTPVASTESVRTLLVGYEYGQGFFSYFAPFLNSLLARGLSGTLRKLAARMRYKLRYLVRYGTNSLSFTRLQLSGTNSLFLSVVCLCRFFQIFVKRLFSKTECVRVRWKPYCPFVKGRLVTLSSLSETRSPTKSGYSIPFCASEYPLTKLFKLSYSCVFVCVCVCAVSYTHLTLPTRSTV